MWTKKDDISGSAALIFFFFLSIIKSDNVTKVSINNNLLILRCKLVAYITNYMFRRSLI